MSYDSRRNLNRRSFLKAAGGSGLVTMSGLAGCIGGGDGDGGDGDGGGGDGDGDGGDGGGTVTGTPSEDAVLVGAPVPLSGPLAAQLGDSERKGIQVAVNYINEEFGGMAGRPVEVIFEDTATDPATGREKARKLVEQDEVDLLAGAVSGAVAASIADYAFGPRVPFWTYGGAAETTGVDCKPTTFRYTTHTTQDALAGAPWAVENLGTNVWIHFADYAYGQSIRNDWETSINESSMDTTIANVTKTPIGHSDFASYIGQIQDSDVDWVLVGVTGADLIAFIRQAEQFGLKDQVPLVSQNVTTVPLRQAIGSAGIGVYGNIRYDLTFDSEDNRRLIDAYEAEYSEVPTDPAMVMWTSLMIHQKAAEEVGSVATEDIVPALEGIEYDSPMGPTQIRACDHQAIRDVPIGRITEPDDYDWPGLETLASRPGEEVIPACEETGCDMPSL